MANKLDFKERATSIMKKKDEMNNTYMKNRGTVKHQLREDKKEDNEEENKVFEEKKTIPFENNQKKRAMNAEEDIDEREYSNYQDPSLNDSPKSMQSIVSINDRRHSNFSIKKMIDLIEGCCTNPLKQVEYIVELFKGVDFILNHENLWPEIFKCDLNERSSVQRLSRDMDYFLHNSLILIENQEQMRTSLLSLIANMTVINYPPSESFGFKCLKSLKELINNDNPFVKNLVIGTLKNVVVPLIKKPDLMKISYNILNGVNLILTSSFNKESSLFEPDLMTYGALWIQQIKKSVAKIEDTESLQRYFLKYEQFIYHDSIMNFLANLTMKKEFAESLSQAEGFKLDQLTSLFERFSFWKTFKFDEDQKEDGKKFRGLLLERTNCILQIIINIAPFFSVHSEYKIPVQDFVRNVLEKRHIEPLLREFNGRSEAYYNGSNIKDYDEDPSERIEELKIYYQNLSQLITTYSKLFRFKDINILEFTGEAIFKTCSYQVLDLLNISKLNPIILKSCAIFLINLFKHPNVEYSTDTKIHVTIQNTLMDYVPLLWFLGGINYETLCWMGTLYTKPFLTLDDEFEFVEVCDQRSTQIQEAFFHVIRVVKLLSNSKSQNTRGTKTAQYSAELCQKTSFVKERNSFLFKAWEMPNDNVKLLICRTFSCLHPRVWMLEDLKIFLDILREMKSFSKKNCDEMIAEIFLIFSKILMFYDQPLEEVLTEAVDLCFEILLNNMERNFRELQEMNSRKIQISVSCIFFLKRASSIKDLHNSFLTPKILFLTKKFFYFEEKYMLENMTPLLLEDTWACSNIEHLLQSTSGNEQIQANTLLGFRLISRIADILQDKTNVDNDEDVDILERDFTEEEEKMEEDLEMFCQWFQPKPSVLINRIRQYFEKNLINKVKNELSTWSQIHKGNFLGNVSNAIKNAKKDEFSKNPELFEDNLSFNGQQIIYRLAMFVLMKEKNFQNKNDISNKTSLSQKIEEFLKGLQRDKLAKEKPNLYEQMKMKNPLDFDPKNLRGKELLEIVLQGIKRPAETELLALYRNQFFDINNHVFLDQMITETYLKNKCESPLKKRIAFDLMDSFNSLDKSNISQLKEKSIIKPIIETHTGIENVSILNKKGVEKLIENLNNKPFEDIINDNFAGANAINLNRNTILLSALFRAMYFANKKSNSSETETVKNQLNSINVLRGLTKLSNDIGWVNSNIGYKYLRAVKFYYTMPDTAAGQDPQMLAVYEIIFKSVNHMLKGIKNNCLDVNEKELLKMEVMFLISEISHCVKVSLEQIRTITWVKNDDLVEERKHKKVRDKNSQEKCIEFVISNLFPLKNFRIIVKILLIYYKIFSDYTMIDQYDNRAIKIKNKIVYNFQKVIAEYTTICDDKKYEILNLFCEFETLLHQPIRQSFLNDILQESDKFYLILSLERYFARENIFFSKEKERIIQLSFCVFHTMKDFPEEEMLFVLTNRGMYVLKMGFSSCAICHKYEFCKEGPMVFVRHRYKEIANIMILEGDQRLGFRINDDKEMLYFVLFTKFTCKQVIEKLLEKKLHIIKLKDTMFEESLNLLSESNKSDVKSGFWVLLSQELNPKMVNKGLHFHRRLLFLTFNNEILIITENPKEYTFFVPKVVGKGYEKIFDKKKKPRDNPVVGVKKTSTKKLLEIEKKFSIKTELSKIIIENDEENMIYLKFGKDVLSMKFSCDYSREKFKQEIMQDLPTDEWKKSHKNLDLSFMRKSKSSQPAAPVKKSLILGTSDLSINKSLNKSANKSMNKSIKKILKN